MPPGASCSVVLEYRILGPLEVASNGTGADLGRPQQRALLAILLLHANEIVSVDRLIDELGAAIPLAETYDGLETRLRRLAAQGVDLIVIGFRRRGSWPRIRRDAPQRLSPGFCETVACVPGRDGRRAPEGEAVAVLVLQNGKIAEYPVVWAAN